MESLYLYMKEIWSVIKENKEINIPNQKIMVSTYRCQEVKNDSLNNSIKQFDQLKSDLKDNKKVDLKAVYDQILKSSIDYFRNKTKYYDEEIALEKIEELKERVQIEFQSIFKVENKKYSEELIMNLQDTMRSVINSKKQSTEDVLREIQSKQLTCKGRYLSFLKDVPIEEKMKLELKELFTLQMNKEITHFLANSMNIFLKKLTRLKM